VAAKNISNVSENVTDVVEKYRPWYMSGGTQWPLPAAKSSKRGRRMALLWPEEDPGSDRITNQLMFVPPSPPAGDIIGERLKNILFYYGLGSWFTLKPGRDMFREARCPVDTCNITLDQKQTADADAILYHHRFAHPGHPRPPRQVRILYFLYSRSSMKVVIECRVLLCLPEIRYLKFVTRLKLFFFFCFQPSCTKTRR
jgi:glycoprotein 3-alpha-L-fucosyltransferase